MISSANLSVSTPFVYVDSSFSFPVLSTLFLGVTPSFCWILAVVPSFFRVSAGRFSASSALSVSVALSAFFTATSFDFSPSTFGESAFLVSSSFGESDFSVASDLCWSAAFFSSNFLFASATVLSNFSVASVNIFICSLTFSNLASLLSNTNLASSRISSNSFAIALYFSFSVALIDVVKLIDNFFNSPLAIFILLSDIFLSSASESPSSPLDAPLDDEWLVILSLLCCVGIFSAFADIPPKKIRDAIATLAAPKWYFLIEKRRTFFPSLYLNPITEYILSINYIYQKIDRFF